MVAGGGASSARRMEVRGVRIENWERGIRLGGNWWRKWCGGWRLGAGVRIENWERAEGWASEEPLQGKAA